MDSSPGGIHEDLDQWRARPRLHRPTYLDYGAGNTGPYFKMGNYKDTFTWEGTTPRFLHFDEYRMGDASYSYKGVSPGPNTYENFDYSSGATLAEANGGFGWAGSWVVSGGVGVAIARSAEFSYPGLPSSRNHLQIYDTDGIHQSASRTLARTYGAGEETYWISFLATKLSSGREARISFGGLEFRAAAGDWQLKTPSTPYTTLTGADYGSLHLFLVKVEASSTGDTARVWKDPNLSLGEPVEESALATVTDPSRFPFYSITIKHGPWGNAAQSGEWDEIRIGDSFWSVIDD